MEFGAADRLEDILQQGGILSPDQGLEQRIGEPGKDGSGNYLRPELGAFGDAA